MFATFVARVAICAQRSGDSDLNTTRQNLYELPIELVVNGFRVGAPQEEIAWDTQTA